MECTDSLRRPAGDVDKPRTGRERQEITPRRPVDAGGFLPALLAADREFEDVYRAGRLIALARQIERT